MNTMMKRTLVCMTTSLMVGSGTLAADYTWNNASGDRDLMTLGNWNPVPSSFVANDAIWIHESGVIGSMSTNSPHLAVDPGFAFWPVVVGFAGGLGGGRIDIDAGGTLTAAYLYMGWGDENVENASSIISLNATNSSLVIAVSGAPLEVGKGGINAQLINNGGTISGQKLWVGTGTGSAQVDLLAGDIWLGNGDADVLTVSAGNNINIEAGRLIILGDRIALINDLLANGRLTGYGKSYNIAISTNAVPLWTTVTATPQPPLLIGDIMLDLLPGANDLSLTWTTIVGYGYTVESKANLQDANWATNTTGIAGTGGDITITTAVDQAQSFYRVIGE